MNRSVLKLFICELVGMIGQFNKFKRMTNGRTFCALFCVALLAACGGGSNDGDDDEEQSTNSGWISLTSRSVRGDVTEDHRIDLSGEAFISPTAGCCSGSATDTAVSVTLRNAATGETGSASQEAEYCWFIRYYLCGHTWDASIRLAFGLNQVEVMAADLSGNTARKWVNVTRQDEIAPYVTGSSPAPSDIAVPLNAAIKIFFSEDVDDATINSGSVWLEDEHGNPIAAQINTAGWRFVTLTPWTELAPNSSYSMSVTTAIRDPAGNSLSHPYNWQFVTGAAPDRTAPRLVSTIPADRADCVGIDSSLSVAFDEAMDPDSIDNSSFQLQEDFGYTISGSIVYDEPAAIKTPHYKLKLSTPYTARITTEVKDTAGNRLASDYEWHFTTTPSHGNWHSISTIDAPVWRRAHTAVWTGSEMIVWGGLSSNTLESGGRYDPVADSWQATSTIGAPFRRYGHRAVWTGDEMIVWGNGVVAAIRDNPGTGGKYDPVADSWMPTSTLGAPVNRKEFTLIWTGREMIVWGGRDWAGKPLDSGARYDPIIDSWTAMSTLNVPLARSHHTAVWSGREMIVWGGMGSSGKLRDGARYDPAADTWFPISMLDAPAAGISHTSVWSGNEMIVWGGVNLSNEDINSGSRYNPLTDSWTPMSSDCAPGAKSNHLAVWAADRMIVWGGGGSSGGLYDPASDSWRATSNLRAPDGHSGRTNVWTGEEMIVWSGSYPDGRFRP